ncbi:hypothetical protein J2847_005114 [Azospirillum agricola]|uniref:hypothetical protein n=1 Tax=Azospirillum agricola TaxID=1720247 RepID=UPI001AEAB418|nr:hypothetical protein [Azospirillum agricola]MBP2231795.1 hypothetical protein [Azospirillum agricola]
MSARHDVPALLAEVDGLPNPDRCLLSHNERELILFCRRLGEALRAEHDLAGWNRLGKAAEGLMP